MKWSEQRTKVTLAYRMGESLRSIGDRLGYSAPTIAKYLSRWGVVRRGTPHGGKPTKRPVRPGDRFGRLTTIGRDDVTYPTRWFCKCACGRIVSMRDIRTKKSCGCLRGVRPRGRRT
jgi:hypothetical protein